MSFCGVTDTTILDICWCLPWSSMVRIDPSLVSLLRFISGVKTTELSMLKCFQSVPCHRFTPKEYQMNIQGAFAPLPDMSGVVLGANLLFSQIFPKNSMKRKEDWSREGRVSDALLDPPIVSSIYVCSLHQNICHPFDQVQRFIFDRSMQGDLQQN